MGLGERVVALFLKFSEFASIVVSYIVTCSVMKTVYNGGNTLVDINFKTKKLWKTFKSERKLSRKYGDPRARAIKMQLAVLRNAQTLSQVPTVRPIRRHQLNGNRAGQYAVDLDHKYRLLFKPDHDPVPERDAGGTDTDGVTAITILEVSDYH